MRAKNGIEWKEEELIYIVLSLCEFVLTLSEYEFYHSDIKPENIVILH